MKKKAGAAKKPTAPKKTAAGRSARAGLKVMVAKRAGFCFGVKRAMDITFDVARKDHEGVFTLGPIIHNPQVIARLRGEGIIPLNEEEVGRGDIRTLIIRTHGIPQQLCETIIKSGCKVIDATCPFVKKAQHYAKLLNENGYQVMIVGDSGHPEVKGILSYAGDDAVVVDGESSVGGIKPKVGIIVQTTQPVETLKKVLCSVIEVAREVKVYNTICNSTALRLRETEAMARSADVMVVVGGRNSANTTQLANLCRSLGVKTHHIETAREVRKSWFAGSRQVGITAGASTPDWIITEVEKRIRHIGGATRNGT